MNSSAFTILAIFLLDLLVVMSTDLVGATSDATEGLSAAYELEVHKESRRLAGRRRFGGTPPPTPPSPPPPPRTTTTHPPALPLMPPTPAPMSPPTPAPMVSPIFPGWGPFLIANSNMGVSMPMDVKIHTADRNQLWVANYGQNNILVLHNPQDPPSMRVQIWQDRAEYHYNNKLASLGFDDTGSTVVACLASQNTYYGMFEANFFMGPTVYEVYPVGDLYGRPNNPVASVAADGQNCTSAGFPNCFLVHSDMLHESPQCMGAVHDSGAVTQGGLHVGATRSNHVYFYSDGLHGELMRFDTETLHGPGILDHRTANIRRYVDIHLRYVDGVPGHMVLDQESRILYIADPGNSRVLRVWADGGEFKRVAQCVPDVCYPNHESYEEGSCANGYCNSSSCSDSDGYGCYHIFTETADIFEYELWGCSTQDVLVSNLELPSGLALGRGRLFVGDYASGRIHVYSLDGTEIGHLPVSSRGLTGLELSCGLWCTLYFANAVTQEVNSIAITGEYLNVPPTPLVHNVCGFVGDLSRPAFNVTHGPGYQNTMVVKYSYGKHCNGFSPGADVEEMSGMNLVQVFQCADRTDCENLNGDALLMAGYLCHHCLPNPCAFNGTDCRDLRPYRCVPGFQCISDGTEPQGGLYCGQTTSTTSTSMTSMTTSSTASTETVSTTSSLTTTASTETVSTTSSLTTTSTSTTWYGESSGTATPKTAALAKSIFLAIFLLLLK